MVGNRLELVRPCKEYREAIQLYKDEFILNNDSMDGTSFLKNMETINDWLAHLESCLSPETVPDGLVPSSTYLALRKEDGYLVGMIDIRHCLNSYLSQIGGHIGYSVRKSERNKGYASEILGLGLEKCRKKGFERVFITCDRNNVASEKVIIKNKGVLEDEIEINEKIFRRFWIQLK